MSATPRPRVLIASHDPLATEFLEDNLTADGYQPATAPNTELALAELNVEVVDAIILDLGGDNLRLLDALAGRAVCLAICEPRTAWRVRLLERGADDALARPYSYTELRARLACLLRRRAATRTTLRGGGVRIELERRRTLVGDTEVCLSAKEYELLRTLITDPERVFTRSELLRAIWGLESWARTRTVDSHASRLRRKLAAAGAPGRVQNVWGIGYRLSAAGIN